jgi:hypothetical protein
MALGGQPERHVRAAQPQPGLPLAVPWDRRLARAAARSYALRACHAKNELPRGRRRGDGPSIEGVPPGRRELAPLSTPSSGGLPWAPAYFPREVFFFGFAFAGNSLPLAAALAFCFLVATARLPACRRVTVPRHWTVGQSRPRASLDPTSRSCRSACAASMSSTTKRRLLRPLRWWTRSGSNLRPLSPDVSCRLRRWSPLPAVRSASPASSRGRRLGWSRGPFDNGRGERGLYAALFSPLAKPSRQLG